MDPVEENKSKIAEVEKEIKAVATGIKEAKERIERAEAAGNASELQRWVKEKEQLQDEKNKLLDKENKLLDEKARLQSAGIAASPANIGALLKLLASAPQQFSQYTQDQRSASRSQISLPAEDVAELKIWMHEVENNNNVRKATKSLSDMLNTAERAGAVAVRYWRFRTGAATGVQLNDLVDIMVAAHKDPKLERPKEILFHRGLLAYFQAAALGQPDVRFEVEDFSRENKSREDVRTFATIRRPPFAVERPCHPNENKRTWHRANAQDPTGISQNKEALSKLWKCIRVHMADEVEEQPSIVGTISSRFELLFFAEFEFRTLPDGSRTLAAVYLAPAPPSYRPPAGGDCLWLVPDLDAKLLSLERLKKDERTLAAILPLRPPEGFTAGVRYVDHIAQKHNIQVATLQLRPGAFCIAEDNGFVFSSQTEPVDLDESDAYHGPNSVVLHPWGANFVVKIADFEKIKKEVEMHRLIDKSSCPHLRKALLDMSGMIEGAGPGLAGIVLCGHLYRSINSTDCTAENGSLGAYYFVQVEAALVALHEVPVIHRDIKPSNILLSPGNTPRERIAILNDYGESCREDEFVRGGYGRLLYTSPSVDEGGFSTRDDDYFALGLTFAHLNNLQVDDPYSSSGKLELINKLCGLNEVYEKCLGKFLHVLKVTG